MYQVKEENIKDHGLNTNEIQLYRKGSREIVNQFIQFYGLTTLVVCCSFFMSFI